MSVFSINILLDSLAETLKKTDQLSALTALHYEDSMPRVIHAKYSDGSSHQISISNTDDQFRIILEILQYYAAFLGEDFEV